MNSGYKGLLRELKKKFCPACGSRARLPEHGPFWCTQRCAAEFAFHFRQVEPVQVGEYYSNRALHCIECGGVTQPDTAESCRCIETIAPADMTEDDQLAMRQSFAELKAKNEALLAELIKNAKAVSSHANQSGWAGRFVKRALKRKA